MLVQDLAGIAKEEKNGREKESSKEGIESGLRLQGETERKRENSQLS